MPQPAAQPVERLSYHEIPSNLTLSRSVGWQDVAAEWRVLHEAACVLGVRLGDRVIAQGAVGVYASAASIAKMVVAPEFQGQGLGGRVLDALVTEAERLDLKAIGLVATPAGEPLYRSRQFSAAGEIVVMTGTPLPAAVSSELEPLLDVEIAITLDRRFTACERAGMLGGRFREACAHAMLVQHGRSGFALATAHGEHSVVGPVMAETEEAARVLVGGVFAAVGGPVRIDVPAEHQDFRRWLVGLGLKEQAVRVEMARGATNLPWQVPQRFALATQAWG